MEEATREMDSAERGLGVRFDPKIMRRYDREGPRYTSYPSARQFRGPLAGDAYERAARGSIGALQGNPLSVYAHLPFCSSPCFYCGCNKVVTRQMGRVDTYVQHLLEEISLRSGYFDRSRIVEQLHFGGGTPTYLPKDSLTALMDRLGREFRLTGDDSRDYSIEIDPRGTDEGVLRVLAELGFNRVSLGVQDFDADVQRAVNRLQPAGAVAAVYDAARNLGFRSINFDLIYGLPRQTLGTFGATLDQVIAMRPDRLAVYGYAHMPQLFKAQRKIKSGDLPNAATRLALLQLTVDRLCGAGYVYIGMDHFALPDDGLARALEERHAAPQFPRLYDAREPRSGELRRERHRASGRSVRAEPQIGSRLRGGRRERRPAVVPRRAHQRGRCDSQGRDRPDHVPRHGEHRRRAKPPRHRIRTLFRA